MLLAGASGNDGALRLWDPVTGAPIGEPLQAPDDGSGESGPGEIQFVGGGSIWALATVELPDKRVLLASAGNEDGTVQLWDPIAGRPVGELLHGRREGVGELTTLELPDGRVLLASSSYAGAVRLSDPVTGTPVSDLLHGLDDRVTALANVELPPGRVLLASGTFDGKVRLWDPATGRLVGVLSGHDGPVTALASMVWPDGRTALASASADSTVRMWDIDEQTETARLVTGRSITSLLAFQDGAQCRLVFGGVGGIACLAAN